MVLDESKWLSMLILVFISAIFLLSLYESGNLSLGVNDVDNYGGINRDVSEILRKIYVNDSDFQNLTKGNYSGAGAIFNETGESTVYIRINGWYIHKATIELQNGTSKTIGPSASMEELYKEADSLNGSVISTYSQITGGEFYVIIVDTPNETVKSIEKVDELPEWTTVAVIEEVSENEP
ncbi:hypothetical protein MSSIT_0482 [Methanosarcina siciliae T4/M]|uniref:Uncharacterized protein n=2 Tax=Methanosarcina siciliae TaxID=38027 RepID=A0A0E3PAT3_9EURY|nr:hypothetical protein [Methanosarcina siciliae]AKB27201.1 hypothetical protein MSSIT_0482 [Methanosarcina siciliae T4/M]AKB31148.1 hypothetical protein MSSIH_0458 [Methanosarcina siciliae HI350]